MSNLIDLCRKVKAEIPADARLDGHVETIVLHTLIEMYKTALSDGSGSIHDQQVKRYAKTFLLKMMKE